MKKKHTDQIILQILHRITWSSTQVEWVAEIGGPWSFSGSSGGITTFYTSEPLKPEIVEYRQLFNCSSPGCQTTVLLSSTGV